MVFSHPAFYLLLGGIGALIGILVRSYGGLFVFIDRKSFVSLFYLSIYVVGLVCFCELSFSVLLLSLILGLLGVLFFLSTNFFIFYVFFEMSLFPIIFIILMDGVQIEKLRAATYLLFYALGCSLPFLLTIFYISWRGFNYFEGVYSFEVIIFLLLAFIVKFPVYFFHLWLPKAHVEAPTYARVILAGLLLKLGSAGLLRMLFLFNYVGIYVLVFFALMGIVVGSLVCSFQRDGKAIVAYSSIAHINFLLLLLVINYRIGKVSRVLLILVHGYCSSLIFLIVGRLFHVINTRKLYFMNSLFARRTILTAFIILSIVINFSTPPRSGFVRELSGMSVLFLSSYVLFIALGFYIFYVCYYSLYLCINIIGGTGFIYLKEEPYFFFYPFIFILFNLFWLGFLF